MAKISGEMIQKYNGQMRNGWQFDIDHFIYHREKGAALRVNLDEKHFLAASLYYSDQYDHATRKTLQHIHLHISLYTRERDTEMAVSHGMGRFFKLGEYERKNFAEIIKKTADFDAAKIRALYERNRAALETPYANGGAPEIEFDGGRIVDSAAENRVQIFFGGKPPAETRAELKSCGFRWAPSVGAWQAFRSSRALNHARRICGVVEA